MFTPEEKQFMEMASKFRDELSHIDKQIDELTARRSELLHVLHGDPSVKEILSDETVRKSEVPTKMPKKRQPAKKSPKKTDDGHLNTLVEFIKKNQGTGRKAINLEMSHLNLSPEQIRRLLEKGRRRGLIISEGRSRSAKWYAAEQ